MRTNGHSLALTHRVLAGTLLASGGSRFRPDKKAGKDSGDTTHDFSIGVHKWRFRILPSLASVQMFVAAMQEHRGTHPDAPVGDPHVSVLLRWRMDLRSAPGQTVAARELRR